MSALLASVHTMWGQPTLGIAATNNQAVCFWANASGTNGVLQKTSNLTSPQWVTVTDAIPVNYTPYAAVAVTPSSSVEFYRLYLNPPTADGMALIPAGSFTMGDTLDGDTDAIPTNIYVSAFYMDTNLVSYSQWLTVYYWATNHGYGFDNAGSGKGANHPVQTVNWYDSVKWCNARSQLAGLIPQYYMDAAFTRLYTNKDTDAVFPNWTANGYRLPTEAEWEKAARGGLSGQRFPWGDTISQSQANYISAPGIFDYDLSPYSGYNTNFDAGYPANTPYTSPVGYFVPNGYGLYDMAGNALVWCWDWYAIPYGQPTTNNPTGPSSGSIRVQRGGSWGNFTDQVMCADRFQYLGPNSTVDGLGFRCVRNY